MTRLKMGKDSEQTPHRRTSTDGRVSQVYTMIDICHEGSAAETTRYHCTPNKMAKIQNTDTTKCR